MERTEGERDAAQRVSSGSVRTVDRRDRDRLELRELG